MCTVGCEHFMLVCFCGSTCIIQPCRLAHELVRERLHDELDDLRAVKAEEDALLAAARSDAEAAAAARAAEGASARRAAHEVRKALVAEYRREVERKAAQSAAAAGEAARLAAAEAAERSVFNRERTEWRAAEYLVKVDAHKVRPNLVGWILDLVKSLPSSCVITVVRGQRKGADSPIALQHWHMHVSSKRMCVLVVCPWLWPRPCIRAYQGCLDPMCPSCLLPACHRPRTLRPLQKLLNVLSAWPACVPWLHLMWSQTRHDSWHPRLLSLRHWCVWAACCLFYADRCVVWGSAPQFKH